MQVLETQTKNGRDMIKVAVDMADNDNQPGFFTKEFRDDIRPNKTWPHGGTVYVVVLDKNGNCSKNFKSFITAVEKSNSGFVIQWGDNFSTQFKGKKIGGVYGEVENEWNGKTNMRRELRWFIDDDKVESAKFPEPKYLPSHNTVQTAPAAAAPSFSDFVEVTGDEDMDLPFC